MKRLFALLCMASALLPLSAKDLYVNSQTYEVDTIVTKHKIGPGTTYAYYRLPDRPMEIHVLEVDLSNPYINIEVCNGGDAAVACETPSHMYMRHDSPGHDMVAATNGDFYSTGMGEVGISRMGLYCVGECIFNPTGNPLFVMDKQNNPWISYVNFAGTVSDGTSTIRLHTVNQLRLEWETETAANQLSLYTGAFGTATHSTTTGGKVATLKAVAGSASFPSNSPITMTVESVADNAGQVPIPEDGAVLYGVGTSADFVGSLAVGSTVTINLGTTLTSYPDVTEVREAIGGSGHRSSILIIPTSTRAHSWESPKTARPSTRSSLTVDTAVRQALTSMTKAVYWHGSALGTASTLTAAAQAVLSLTAKSATTTATAMNALSATASSIIQPHPSMTSSAKSASNRVNTWCPSPPTSSPQSMATTNMAF
jgi:hypothetical protein